MSVLAVNSDLAVAATALAAGTSVALAGLATAVSRRSTDRAEERYRKSLDADLVSLFEATLGDHEGVVDADIVVDNTPADTPHHRLEDEARRRMAALPIDYHAQVLAQSRQSFIFSIGAAVVGFLIIALSILLVLGDQVAPGIASMVGAAIAEAVAALFFRQSNQARALMSGQLEGFRAAEEVDRQARERKELIQLVEDSPTRDELITQTVLRLTDPDRNLALPTITVDAFKR